MRQVQILCDICTRFAHYLYSEGRESWIITMIIIWMNSKWNLDTCNWDQQTLIHTLTLNHRQLSCFKPITQNDQLPPLLHIHSKIPKFPFWFHFYFSPFHQKILFLRFKSFSDSFSDNLQSNTTVFRSTARLQTATNMIKIQDWTGFGPTTSVTLVQCSTNWAIKPSGSWSHCGFLIYIYLIRCFSV